MNTRTELSTAEIKPLLSRLPTFELSYEIFKHNTTEIKQTIAQEWSFHIPVGHKWFVWFSFRGKKHGLFWMELNRNRIIQRVFFQEATPPSSLDETAFYGTIFYGTQIIHAKPESLVQTRTESLFSQTPGHFVLEDVFYFKGNFVHCLPEINKWALLPQFLQQHSQYGLCLPVINGNFGSVPYPTHHIQIRHLTKTCPFTNWPVPKSQNHTQTSKNTLLENEIVILKPAFKNWRKEQYQMDTVFSVQADPADDIYRLYTFGPNRQLLFYDFCMIQDYETSKKMNSLFRHVRENQNLDWIEESDDDDSINDDDTTKPTITEQPRLMVCRFHPKFRKWTPLHLAPPKSRTVHICQL